MPAMTATPSMAAMIASQSCQAKGLRKDSASVLRFVVETCGSSGTCGVAASYVSTLTSLGLPLRCTPGVLRAVQPGPR